MSNKHVSLRSVVITAALTALVTTLIGEWVPQLITKAYTQITEKRRIVVNVKRDRQPISGVDFSVSILQESSVLSSGTTDERGIVVLYGIPSEDIVIIEAVLREGSYERIYVDSPNIDSLPYHLTLEVGQDFSAARLVGRSFPLSTIYPKCNSVVPRPRPNYYFLFRWKPVPEAESYTVEIDCLSCGPSDSWEPHIRPNLGLRTRRRPIYSTMFYQGLEDHSFRWRVWAVDSSEEEGEKSPWCDFSFSDGLDS
jgi:hypothetical protein